MKKLIYLTIAIIAVTASSCGDDGNTWSDYKDWREANTSWYQEQAQLRNPDGTPFYTNIRPKWYPQSGVLVHYFNDRRETAGNLSPLLTSHVTVKYVGKLYNGTTFDSTTVGSDSVRTFQLSDVVVGWQVALSDMRVGDTCQIIVPYGEGYGINGSSSINPFSTLQFNIRLVDIPDYLIP